MFVCEYNDSGSFLLCFTKQTIDFKKTKKTKPVLSQFLPVVFLKVILVETMLKGRGEQVEKA